MDKTECDRVGLGSAKPTHSGESLAQEFIKFLEKESVPMSNPATPKLLNMSGSSTSLRKKSIVKGSILIYTHIATKIKLILTVFV